MPEKATQDSFFTKEGLPNEDIIKNHEILEQLRTNEQFTRAIDLISEGVVHNLYEAYQYMVKEDAANPVNDAHSK